MIAAEKGHREILELLVKKGANLSLLDDRDNNILHVASLGGSLETVKYIHSQNIIDIDSRGENGTTPLRIAALFGKMEVFSFLIKIGAEISKEDHNGGNILHVACQGGNVDIVKCVLRHKALYINSTDYKGITPLMSAAGYGNKVVFHVLIDRGADALAKDATNRNILHWTCQGGNVKILNFILTRNIVDINSRNRDKMTPLLLAAYYKKRDVIDLLIERGAHTLAVDHKSRNILYLSCSSVDLETVNYILKQNIVDINTKGEDGKTQVLVAAYLGNGEVFDILVKKGANLSVVTNNRDNILHLAIRGGNIKIVKYILTQDVVVIDSKGFEDMTPVLLAADVGNIEVFDILVNKGADLSVVDKDGESILHLAIRERNVKMVNYILTQDMADIDSKGSKDMTPVLLEAYMGNIEVFDILVNKGANLSVVNEDGDNVLHLAIRGENVKMVNYILTQDIVDINSKGFEDMTPVLLALDVGSTEIFDILVNKGADLSVVNEDEESILHLAIEEGNVEIVNSILAQNIVDINSTDCDGTTPVLLTALMGNIEVFDILVNKGADLSVVDDDGNNVLHLACLEGNEDIVKRVLSMGILDVNTKNDKGLNATMIAREKGYLSIAKSLSQVS
ncbi:putative ankyrin repeat protein RF_0381 [Haliotis rubra]|uniref:putative ankyrin repeat protein RF_0381 n=1 Tax=Haliotis rubra TaxID=36100 RepID=UPI001EE5F1E5|nr:putative ankyrin repeat protein RF_0381 [Haliotis rubra]